MKKLLLAAILTVLLLCGCENSKAPAETPPPTPIPYADRAEIKTAKDALKRLEDGNMNFLLGNSNSANIGKDVRIPLANQGEKPYAIVLACSDSRLAPEHIFDTGLGEIMVIRTLGNVVGEFELAAIENAVKKYDVPLVFVLGHTGCDAIAQTLDEENPAQGHMKSVTDVISPVLKEGAEFKNYPDPEEYIAMCEDINITISLYAISTDPELKELFKEKGTELAGGKYSTEFGRVMFRW